MSVSIRFWCDECGCALFGSPPYSRVLPSSRQEHACSERCRDALLAKIDKYGRVVERDGGGDLDQGP